MKEREFEKLKFRQDDYWMGCELSLEERLEMEMLRENEHTQIIADEMRDSAQFQVVETEFELYDESRVDIYAMNTNGNVSLIEVEWAHKWKEAPGQTIFFTQMYNSIHHNIFPGIILLAPKSRDVKRFILRCALVCQKLNIPMRVREVDK